MTAARFRWALAGWRGAGAALSVGALLAASGHGSAQQAPLPNLRQVPVPTTAPRPETPGQTKPGAKTSGNPSNADTRLPAAAEPVLPAPSTTGSTGSAGDPSVTQGDRAYGAYQRGMYLTAIDLARPLANLGDASMQTLLGEIYSRGLGVPRDDREAARWYKTAADAGRPEAQFQYALLLLEGKAVPQDIAGAHDLMKAAADAGIAQAEFNVAQMLIQASPTGGFEEARPYFEKAADAGIADAQYALSQMYEYGRGVAAADPAAARAWLAKAAASGHDTAQVELGIWLINGKGGAAVPQEGFGWLRRAAARGNPIAMNRLAHLYKDGIGTGPDKREAAMWAVLAKRADNTDGVLDDFFRGLDDAAKRAALEAANRFRAS